jgi:hypothetical protein
MPELLLYSISVSLEEFQPFILTAEFRRVRYLRQSRRLDVVRRPRPKAAIDGSTGKMTDQLSREAAKPRRDGEQLSALAVESAYRLHVDAGGPRTEGEASGADAKSADGGEF